MLFSVCLFLNRIIEESSFSYICFSDLTAPIGPLCFSLASPPFVDLLASKAGFVTKPRGLGWSYKHTTNLLKSAALCSVLEVMTDWLKHLIMTHKHAVHEHHKSFTET